MSYVATLHLVPNQIRSQINSLYKRGGLCKCLLADTAHPSADQLEQLATHAHPSADQLEQLATQCFGSALKVSDITKWFAQKQSLQFAKAKAKLKRWCGAVTASVLSDAERLMRQMRRFVGMNGQRTNLKLLLGKHGLPTSGPMVELVQRVHNNIARIPESHTGGGQQRHKLGHWDLWQASDYKFNIPSTPAEANSGINWDTGTYGKHQTTNLTFLVHQQRPTRA